MSPHCTKADGEPSFLTLPFLAATPQGFESDASHNGEQERIAELERMIGKLTIELEIAKKHCACWMGCGRETGGSDDDENGISGENHLWRAGIAAQYLLSHSHGC